MYKCKQCGKESHYKSSLTCSKCMRHTTSSYPDNTIIEIPSISYNYTSQDISSSNDTYTGGGGDFGGGGSSGDF